METVRTIICKLDPTPDQAADIDATLKAFAKACDFAADTARRIGSTNKVKVQHEAYHAIRTQFGLSANLAIRAIARACAALKDPKKMHSKFGPTSIDYDQRIFSFIEWLWIFSLTLLSGRAKIATILGEFQKESLKGRNPTSATLVKRSDGSYYLHVQIKDQATEPLNTDAYLGVDLGIVNIATDSEGEAFSGKSTERNRKRRATARKQYQRKGTKNAKRRLKKMAKRQSRYQAWVNHNISRRLVEKAKTLGIGIAMENLSGLRDRCEQTANRRFRRRLGNWGFFQLRQFVTYKALRAGVPVVFVNPRNTSRTCSACGHCEKANRPSQALFKCKQCGYSTNADENAAKNISLLGPSCKPASKVSG